MSPITCSTLATSCEELTHWKRLWCWEGLGARGEGDDRGWDGWMASLTRWTWVWVNSGSWWWTGRPGMLWFMGSQRVGHDWVTELNWTELTCKSEKWMSQCCQPCIFCCKIHRMNIIPWSKSGRGMLWRKTERGLAVFPRLITWPHLKSQIIDCLKNQS